MARMSTLFLAALAVATGCGGGAYRSAARPMDPAPASWPLREESGGAEFQYEHKGKDAPEKPAEPTRVAGDVGGEAAPAPLARMIVYTGAWTVDVYDVKKAQEALTAFVTERGGYMQQTRGDLVVLRIPAGHFDAVEPRLRELGRVDDRLTDVRAQDITEEYTDLELRLKTKRDYLESLRGLLEQAGKLDEKLAVQQEIARVVEEVEAMEGRRRLLRQLVDLATVTVTFRLAQAGARRTFRLPWEWLDELGLEGLLP